MPVVSVMMLLVMMLLFKEPHPNNIPMTTVPWFSYYDDTYRDTFLPPRTWASISPVMVLVMVLLIQ